MEENVSICEDQTQLAWTVQSSYMQYYLLDTLLYGL